MARIKIDIPENKLAQVKIPVRISDINYGNHVGNDAFVSIIHEARMQWLQQQGYTELDFAGVGLIMSDLAIEFKNESFYGDIIEVAIYSGETARVSFELFYQLSAIRNNTKIILANAKTGMISYSYENKKPVSLPESVLKLLVREV
jgi:acyl-CoA thioester hydrolase